jgi:putative DNA primase/helicase
MPTKIPAKRKRPADSLTDDDPSHDNQILRASDCPPEPVEWLWPEKLPIGKVTLLIGDPGTGKSLLAADLAARVSTGRPLPGEKQGAWSREPGSHHSTSRLYAACGGEKQLTATGPDETHIPASRLPAPCSVLMLSSEDELADTIRPRLDAAGANCNRVFFLPDIKDLRTDFHKLRDAVDCVRDCRLLIIDPINAYVGPSDSHYQTVTQQIMEPLARLAAEKRIAVVAVAHFRKSDGAAIYRAAGSLGFVSAARAVWTVCRDNSQPGRHLFLPLKCNLAPTACGLAFTIETNAFNNSPTIEWSDSPISKPAADAIATSAKKRGPEAIELHDASLWLRKKLAAGRQPADDLLHAGADLGFQDRTLRRALHAIGGQSQKGEIWEGWWWSIPAIKPTTPTRPSAPGSAGGSPTDYASTPTPPSAPGSAGGSPSARATTPSTPGRAGGGAPQTSVPNPQSKIRNPQSLHPSQQPVPFVETCPLPGNLNASPSETCPLPEIFNIPALPDTSNGFIQPCHNSS